MNNLVGKVKDITAQVYQEVLKFGAVGAIAFAIDFCVNSLLILPASPLHQSPVWAKVISGLVASLFSWFANRYWAFNGRNKRGNVWAEFLLFLIMNGIGILIAAACVWFSKYALGFDGPTASLIAGQGVGLILGTIFRYFAYKFIVFREKEDPRLAEVLGVTPADEKLEEDLDKVTPSSSHKVHNGSQKDDSTPTDSSDSSAQLRS